MSFSPTDGGETPRTASPCAPTCENTLPVGAGPTRSRRSAFTSDLPTIAGLSRGAALPDLGPPRVTGDLGACGGHRVLRLLGRGGMGAVYEALDTALNRRVALKLMLPALAASDEGRERFLREARAAAAVRHENVVQVYAVGEDRGTPFLTMELLRGSHLGHLMDRGVPPAEVVRIGREVALGLAAAHALGVIHRDIKPANVWIEEPSGRARLLDFGLARLGDDVSAVMRGGPGPAPALTQLGAMIGTPMYMAPEQVNGEATDARTDLFNLGAVLYHMVTGRGPFNGPTLFDLADAVRRGVFTPVPEVIPGVQPALARLIHRLLAPDPADRPPTAVGVADELLSIGTGLLISSGARAVAIPVPAPGPADPDFDFDAGAAPAPRRRIESPVKLLLGTGAALLATFLAVGVLHRLSARRPVPPPPAEAARPVPPVAPKAAPFVPLFNGRDLTGWRPPQGLKSDAWAVRDGAIVGTPKPGMDQILLSDAAYADFELRLEYRWPNPGGHTVVGLRAPDAANLLDTGVAVNIGDDEGFPAVHGRVIGGLYRTGLVQGVTFNPSAANRPMGQWNELHVTARRQTVEVKVNRVAMPTADLTTNPVPGGRAELNRPAGPVALVCHWGPVEFRNISVRPLTEPPKN